MQSVSVGQGNGTWSIAGKKGSPPSYRLDKTLGLHLYEYIEEDKGHFLVLRLSVVAHITRLVNSLFFKKDHCTQAASWEWSLVDTRSQTLPEYSLADSGNRLTLIQVV